MKSSGAKIYRRSLACIVAFGLASALVSAQERGSHGSGSPPSASRGGSLGPGAGLPPIQPIPPLGYYPGARPPSPRGRGYGAYGGYPLYWGGYAGDFEPTPPNNYFAAPPPPVFVEPPPPPPRSEVHEYGPGPEPAQNQASSEQLFVIALKDGSQISAAAVWAQGGELRTMDPDGNQRRVPLATIDRDATRNINRARNLRLQIPPTP